MIKNLSKRTTISRRSWVASSPLQKAIGLMFQKPKALIFTFARPKIVPLHMWFVFYPIDVLILNEKRKVIEIKKDFRPWTFYTPKKPSAYLIELPAGTITKTKTGLRDQIQLF